MGYIADYAYFLSGTEIPQPFLLWSALSLEGALCGKKIWTMHGDYFPISPNLYVCFVGSPSSGKSTAKDWAKDIFVEFFPNYMYSAEIQSREDIISKMASPECCKTWKDSTNTMGKPGEIMEFRPFYALVDEMSNFISVESRKMIDFLVGVHSSKNFGTGFKRDAGLAQSAKNPFFSLLGCCPPEWFMQNMRVDLFNGGLGRRLIIVHAEKDLANLKPNPKKPSKGDDHFRRVIEHLREVDKLVGRMEKTPAAQLFWDEWYLKHFKQRKDDPILKQFDSSKHVMVLKVAMLLSLDTRPFSMQITDEHLAAAVAMLDVLEPEIIKLTSGIGANVIAAVAAQMEQYLAVSNGRIQERRLCQQFFKMLPNGERDYNEALRYLEKTDKIRVVELIFENSAKRWVLTPIEYEKEMKSGKYKILPTKI